MDKEILDKIRGAKVLYVDETSIKVQGKKYWIWAFTTPVETFIAIRNSRGMKVLHGSSDEAVQRNNHSRKDYNRIDNVGAARAQQLSDVEGEVEDGCIDFTVLSRCIFTMEDTVVGK